VKMLRYRNQGHTKQISLWCWQKKTFWFEDSIHSYSLQKGPSSKLWNQFLDWICV